MNNNLLDTPFSEKTALDKDLKTLYSLSFSLAIICSLSWVLLRSFFFVDMVLLVSNITKESDDLEMVHLFISMSYLSIFFLLSFVIIVARLQLIKKEFFKAVIAMTISFLFASGFLWLAFLFTGLMMAGLFRLVPFLVGGIYNLDIAYVIITIGSFYWLYKSLKKKLVELNKNTTANTNTSR